MSKPPTAPTRIDADLFASAQVVGPLASRSAAQQVNHWARIGRALEESPTVSLAAVRAVLSGGRAYDDVGDEEQAVVRAGWVEHLLAEPEGVDLTPAFAVEGRAYVGLGDGGDVVRHEPEGRPV